MKAIFINILNIIVKLTGGNRVTVYFYLSFVVNWKGTPINSYFQWSENHSRHGPAANVLISAKTDGFINDLSSLTQGFNSDSQSEYAQVRQLKNLCFYLFSFTSILAQL